MNRGFLRGFLLGVALPFDLLIYTLNKLVQTNGYHDEEITYFNEDLGTMVGAVLVAYIIGAVVLVLAGVIHFG